MISAQLEKQSHQHLLLQLEYTSSKDLQLHPPLELHIEQHCNFAYERPAEVAGDSDKHSPTLPLTQADEWEMPYRRQRNRARGGLNIRVFSSQLRK